MNCDLAKSDMVAYLREELQASKKKQLEEHLAICPACRKELEVARRVLSWTTAASDEKVVATVEALFRSAIEARASDIHLDMQGDGTLLVRQRVDGVLHEVERFDAAVADGIVARIKMLADMNVGETRLAQDGRIHGAGPDGTYDLRVSCCPFAFGTGMVIRLLEPRNVLVGFDGIGMRDAICGAVEDMLRQPCGLIVVAGPTGSGKTTTMYNMLQHVANTRSKIVTIEDPVEYVIPGTNQASVNRSAGYTYAAAVRAYMRHDPDILMVGEIHDREVADLALRAALTGHLVIAGMSVSGALDVPQRFAGMGVDAFLTSGALTAVIAQRLVRRVCDRCRREVDARERESALRALGASADEIGGRTLSEGAGCDACRHTGYGHRTAVFEVLRVDREVSTAIGAGVPADDLRGIAERAGFQDMRRDALQKVLAGITTTQEATRVFL